MEKHTKCGFCSEFLPCAIPLLISSCSSSLFLPILTFNVSLFTTFENFNGVTFVSYFFVFFFQCTRWKVPLSLNLYLQQPLLLLGDSKLGPNTNYFIMVQWIPRRVEFGCVQIMQIVWSCPCIRIIMRQCYKFARAFFRAVKILLFCKNGSIGIAFKTNILKYK